MLLKIFSLLPVERCLLGSKLKVRPQPVASMEGAAKRARRRIKFIGYLRLTGRMVKYVRVDRWESE
jgi:hypothetical protein